MASSAFTRNMGVFLAQQFKESVSESDPSIIYLAIGKIDPWANDAAPDTANTSQDSIFSFWRNMLSGKKITGNDMAHVIPRINWTANTVYDFYTPYSSALHDANTQFYVVTEEYNVYKCLSNSDGANSTIKPTSTNPNTIYQTADGYIWKFMYTISASERLRFTTDQYIPVKTLSIDDGSLQWRVQQAAIAGAIDVIRLTSGGMGYSNVDNISVSITGDGEGATATANINVDSSLVSSITVTSRGSDYSYASVAISGGGGSGATAVAEIGPPGGHGSDALNELGGSYILINPRLKGTESGFITVWNDFRQIALLVDPFAHGTTNVFSNTTFSQTTDLSVSGTGSAYDIDEVVYQGGTLDTADFTARVVDFDSGNNLVRVTDVVGVPTAGVLIGANTLASRFVTSVADADLETYSGSVIYIDNIIPITRNASQTEDIKIIFRFG